MDENERDTMPESNDDILSSLFEMFGHMLDEDIPSSKDKPIVSDRETHLMHLLQYARQAHNLLDTAMVGDLTNQPEFMVDMVKHQTALSIANWLALTIYLGLVERDNAACVAYVAKEYEYMPDEVASSLVGQTLEQYDAWVVGYEGHTWIDD